MKESNWYVIHICSSCEKRLTQDDIYETNGLCPHCGNSSNYVTNYKKLVIKSTRHTPWWNFWNVVTTYEGKNEVSKEWLKRNK